MSIFTARVRSTTGRLCFDTCLSVCPQGGVPISHNALQHFPECHGADTWGGTLTGPAGGGTLPGGYPAGGDTLPGGVPCWGVPCWGVPPQPGQDGGYPAGGYPCRVPLQGTPPARSGWGVPCWGGGYPVRTTEGVLTTRRAVCLLRSRRRTFLFQ